MATKRPTHGETPRTAAIWCRVSTKKQATEDKSSLRTQERLCREKVHQLGAVVDEAHALVVSESASDPQARDRFEWLMREADRHAFDLLVVDVQDRLTRGGQADFFRIVGRLQKAGVTLHLVRDNYDSTDDDADLIASVNAWKNRRENKDRTRRSLDGKQGRVEQGKGIPGGTELYGYRWVDPERGAKTRRRFDDEQSEAFQTVTRIWDTFLTHPSPSLRGLALQLTADGIKSPRAYFGVKGALNRWTPETIRLLLWHPVYWGGDEDGMIPMFQERSSDFSPSAPVLMPTNAPAYVTREQADYVHARLTRNARHRGRPAKRDWLAEGILLAGGLPAVLTAGGGSSPTRTPASVSTALS